MAFARQSIDRRLFELAGFSLPAIAAGVALLLTAHPHTVKHLPATVPRLPPESSAHATPTQEIVAPSLAATPSVPATATPPIIQPPDQALPQVRAIPSDGLGPTTSIQKPDVIIGQPHAVIVQTGHTLWRIAREAYGNGRDYPLIVNANRKIIFKPELIYPGQHFVLPDKKDH